MSRIEDILGAQLYKYGDPVEEIRIKRGFPICYRYGDGEYIFGKTVTNAQFDSIISKMCSDSYHTHEETIKKGYINVGEGIRAGVSGRAVSLSSDKYNISDIDYITVRIPHHISGVSLPLVKRICRKGYVKSVLIYSPPGIGKTTLLRDIAAIISDRPYNKRTVVIDSREEIYLPEIDGSPLLCFYKGYPKGNAIEAAVRTMSPDCIICDEIGSPEEADELIKHQNTGVAVIATAHAKNLSGLLSRNRIGLMHEAGIFDLYCGIFREAGSDTLKLQFTERESEIKVKL